MKRLRREGRRLKGMGKVCLFCGRKMLKKTFGRGRTDYFCRCCRVTYGYCDGRLMGVMGDEEMYIGPGGGIIFLMGR